jgi:hypothetical protein
MFICHRKHRVSITVSHRLALVKDILAVHYENYTKHTSALRGQKQRFRLLKQAVHNNY